MGFFCTKPSLGTCYRDNLMRHLLKHRNILICTQTFPQRQKEGAEEQPQAGEGQQKGTVGTGTSLCHQGTCGDTMGTYGGKMEVIHSRAGGRSELFYKEISMGIFLRKS